LAELGRTSGASGRVRRQLRPVMHCEGLSLQPGTHPRARHNTSHASSSFWALSRVSRRRRAVRKRVQVVEVRHAIVGRAVPPAQALGSFRETLVMESVKLALETVEAPDLRELKYGPLTETPVKNVEK